MVVDETVVVAVVVEAEDVLDVVVVETVVVGVVVEVEVELDVVDESVVVLVVGAVVVVVVVRTFVFQLTVVELIDVVEGNVVVFNLIRVLSVSLKKYLLNFVIRYFMFELTSWQL